MAASTLGVPKATLARSTTPVAQPFEVEGGELGFNEKKRQKWAMSPTFPISHLAMRRARIRG